MVADDSCSVGVSDGERSIQKKCLLLMSVINAQGRWVVMEQ